MGVSGAIRIVDRSIDEDALPLSTSMGAVDCRPRLWYIHATESVSPCASRVARSRARERKNAHKSGEERTVAHKITKITKIPWPASHLRLCSISHTEGRGVGSSNSMTMMMMVVVILFSVFSKCHHRGATIFGRPLFVQSRQMGALVARIPKSLV